MYELLLPPGIKGLRVERRDEFLWEQNNIFYSFTNACLSWRRYVNHQNISSIYIFQYKKILLLKIAKSIPPLRSSFPLQQLFATTTRYRLPVLSLRTDKIIQWLALSGVIDVRSQSVILRKFKTFTNVH